MSTKSVNEPLSLALAAAYWRGRLHSMKIEPETLEAMIAAAARSDSIDFQPSANLISCWHQQAIGILAKWHNWIATGQMDFTNEHLKESHELLERLGAMSFPAKLKHSESGPVTISRATLYRVVAALSAHTMEGEQNNEDVIEALIALEGEMRPHSES